MRILIIEDNKHLAANIAKILEQKTFAVDVANLGEVGLKLAKQIEYDLIILDLMLPDLDGMTICQKLRAQESTAAILMLTANSQLDDKIAGLNAGADDYLTKPFEIAELMARVQALLRRSKHEFVEEKLIIADLSINTLSHQVERAGKIIELTHKEFSLLEYLARNSDRVVNREEILEHVWDQNANYFSNNVDVYIRHLRKKIDDNFEVKLIKTIKNIGYRLCLD
ncbi:MAG: response regulator transcription factor [bacterium]